MNCTIKNPANHDLGDLETHTHEMYDFFATKYGFKKPPTMVFDSDPSNQSNVLGKTAYYDPQSLEIHIFVDGRHPKDILRSIAHELIHHRQNLEDRLDVGGYNGPGYYLENEELKDIDLVFHGHTHRYRQETLDNTIYFNPGESAGMSTGKNAIGIVNLNNLKIKRIFF